MLTLDITVHSKKLQESGGIVATVSRTIQEEDRSRARGGIARKNNGTIHTVRRTVELTMKLPNATTSLARP
jgi:hypothetical protein